MRIVKKFKVHRREMSDPRACMTIGASLYQLNGEMSKEQGGRHKELAPDEDACSADSPYARWTAGGSDLDSEDVFKYPPDAELLGTSWGSYLFSVPPTAHGRSERKVSIAKGPQTQSPVTKQSREHETPSIGNQSSPNRSILRTQSINSNSVSVAVANNLPAWDKAFRTHDRCTTAKSTCTSNSSIQPHPLFHRLLAALQETQEALDVCGINSSPLSVASRTMKQIQQQQAGGNDSQSCHLASEKCVKVVLEALVSQGKKMQEHAISLQKTATMMTRNQHQFAREQQDMQQMLETAFSSLMAQKQALEEKKAALKMQTVTCRVNDHAKRNSEKTYVMGIREGQHKLALAQARKEHSRLEKALLQQQRDLKALEQAYRTTKSELAAEQYSSKKLQKKLHKQSDFHGKLSHKGIDGIQKKFNDHNQNLLRLEHQLEASRQELLETGSRLRAEERNALISTLGDRKIKLAGGTCRQPHAFNLPSIAKTRFPLHVASSHQESVPDQFSLPKLHTGHLSRSELMALAKFRSPEAAEQVISWLEKEGQLK